MKPASFFKMTTIVALFMAMATLSGFDIKTTTTTANQEWTPWSQWFATVDCYKGISYRYRQREATSEKNELQMEFKNSYDKGIAFTYFITTDTVKYEYPLYRFEIKAGQSMIKETYVEKNKKIFLYLARLKFEGDGYGHSYRGCGKGKQIIYVGHPEINSN